MTTTTTSLYETRRAPFGRRELPKATDFVAIDRKPDTSKNARRGARRSNRKTRTIL